MHRTAVLVFFAALWVASVCRAEDWPQWRGPGRDGVARSGVELIDGFGEEGPPLLWESGDIAGGPQGGYGSLAVVDGLVYVYSNWKYRVPIETRTITAQILEARGYRKDMPEQLRAKVEQARLSDERAGLERRQANGWATQWARENIEDRKWHRVAAMRILQGAEGVAAEKLALLGGVIDREFGTQADLDTWLADNGFTQEEIKQVKPWFPVFDPAAHDVVVCLDAGTGETVWKKQLAGGYSQHSSSSTPCIADGRCYVLGSDGQAYCFDAKTGDRLWQAETKGRPGRTMGSSFLVADGMAVVLGGVLMGLEADRGEQAWVQERVRGEYASPLGWRDGDRTLLLCNGGRETFCVDPQTGEVQWAVPGGGASTPVVSGDTMVVFTGTPQTGVIAYKLSAEAPEKAWSFKLRDRGSSPVVHEDHVYVIGGGGRAAVARCVALADGRLAWEQKVHAIEIASPVLADGKILVISRDRLLMYRATPEGYEQLGDAKLKLTQCTSPAIWDGLLYLRRNNAVVCYDMRRK
jgi:outer membrane protein assembly factor BamB